VLAWEPVESAASYEILFRETDQPEWTVLDRVDADAHTFQCPLSKDNYFFAVRTLSPDGHPSLPAVAR